MSKIAFLFAGQGAQYVGMGKELYENFEAARKVFDLANEILGYDVKGMCFEGPEEELGKTENTQPAILATSMAIASVLKEKGIEAEYAAGLSLGEYSALTYANVFKLEDAIGLIRKRGSLMQDAVPLGIGGMAAIMGLERETVKEICADMQDFGVVEVANYNCPGQIVITGECDAVSKAMDKFKEAGALKTVMLNVSGPFHSSMLKEAGDKLEAEIKKVQINEPSRKVISNYDNEYYSGNNNDTVIKLKNQISSSVRWEDNVRKLIEDGVELFVEIGPGKTLTSFLRKIDRSKKVYSVDDLKSLEKLIEELNKVV